MKGKFVMPLPISKAGRKVLIAGSGIALVMGGNIRIVIYDNTICLKS